MKDRMSTENQENEQDKDVWLYRMIIAALGVTVVAIVVGAIVLARTGSSLPDTVVTLGAAAIGGMAGFLVPNHLNR